MQGYVSTHPKEPRLALTILNSQGIDVPLEAVIDTGVTEFLALPPSLIGDLGLVRGQDMELLTAGGRVITSPTYSATITWHAAARRVR